MRRVCFSTLTEGFSLIELLVVVAIMGVLARFLVLKFNYHLVKSKRVEAVQNLSAMLKLHSIMRMEGANHDYPLCPKGTGCPAAPAPTPPWGRIGASIANCYDNVSDFTVSSCKSLRYQYTRYPRNGFTYIIARSGQASGLNYVLSGCRPDLVVAKVETGEIRVCHDTFQSCVDNVYYSGSLEATAQIIDDCFP